MVSTRQTRPQPRTQSYPCKECLPGTQFVDWVCIPMVPLSVWWLLWDNTSRPTQCFWQHLLVSTSRTFLHGADSFQSCMAYTVQYGVVSNSFGKQAWYFGWFIHAPSGCWRCDRWWKFCRQRIRRHRVLREFLHKLGFSLNWGSYSDWAYCHSR